MRLGINRRYVLGLLCLLGVTACAHNGDIKAPQEKLSVIHVPETVIEDETAVANKFALMALFAKTVYRKDLLDDRTIQAQGCDYLPKPNHRDVYLNMPRNNDGSGWQRWQNSGSCYNDHGLFFETYIHTNKDQKVDMAVIAIRGTEVAKDQLVADMKSNTSGFKNWNENEYKIAETQIIPVIYSLKCLYSKDLPIYLTGHSLGGGIAQEIAYLTSEKDIKATYVFNTTPVTNYYRLKKENKVINEHPHIIRVWQNNEFLQLPRNFASAYTGPQLHREDYQVDFFKLDAGSSHFISNLLCHLAARTNQGAEFDYSIENANKTLSDPILCPPDSYELVYQSHVAKSVLLEKKM